MTKRTPAQIIAALSVEELRRTAEVCRRNHEWKNAKRYDAMADAKALQTKEA